MIEKRPETGLRRPTEGSTRPKGGPHANAHGSWKCKKDDGPNCPLALHAPGRSLSHRTTNRVTGSGPFLEVAAGFSDYCLVQGTGDPIEPVPKNISSWVSGDGSGFTLGVGWELQSEFTPRITYSFGREDTLDARGSTIARGWTHNVLLFEVGIRGAL